MKPTLVRKILMTALAGAMAPVGALCANAAEITLKVSHYLPPSHGFQTDFLEPWAKRLKEKTHGAVDVRIYNAASVFGKIDRQADQVRAGVMDMAVGLNGVPRGRYPTASIIETPFLVKSAGSGPTPCGVSIRKACWAAIMTVSRFSPCLPMTAV